MDREQLEMRFNGEAVFRPAARRQGRLTRARWWFDQMRQTVDRAWEWQAASPAKAEQVQMPLARDMEASCSVRLRLGRAG